MSLRTALWIPVVLIALVAVGCGREDPPKSSKTAVPESQRRAAPADATISAALVEAKATVSWMQTSKRTGGLGYSLTQAKTTHAYKAFAILSAWQPAPPPPTTSTTTPVPTSTTTVTTTTTPAPTTTIPPPPLNYQVAVTPTGNDSSCARLGAPCATLKKAYEITEPGDTVQLACGTYGPTTFSTRKPAGPQVTFRPAAPRCVTIGGLDFTFGGDYARLSGLNIVDQGGAIYQGGTVYNYGVILDGNWINVGKRVDSQNINLHLPNGWTIINNTIGPTCCGVGSQSPEGLRIGCYPCNIVSTNVTIEDNLIQGTARFCQYWMAGFGPCPSPTPTLKPPVPLDVATGKFKLASGKLGDCGACHADGIHIWGMTDSRIVNNRVLGVEVQGIFIEPTSGSLQSNIDITGNTVSVVGGNAGIYVKSNDVDNTAGTWNIRNNSSPNLLEFSGGFTGARPGTVFNISGNNMQFVNADRNGNNYGCQGQPVTVTINYGGPANRWISSGGGTAGCG